MYLSPPDHLVLKLSIYKLLYAQSGRNTLNIHGTVFALPFRLPDISVIGSQKVR